MLQTGGLIYRYTNGAELSFPDIHCDAAEPSLLIGPSGSGKTTLLQLIAGLRRPTSGSVMIRDQELTSMSNSRMDQFRGKHIGIVFQTAHFIRSLSVGENLAVSQSLSGHKVDHGKIRSLLMRLNIGDKYNKKTYQLSQGEQQRVAIARAIINEPHIVLADEPTSALDDHNTAEVVKLLTQQTQEIGSTLLIITHDNRLKEHIDKKIEL